MIYCLNLRVNKVAEASFQILSYYFIELSRSIYAAHESLERVEKAFINRNYHLALNSNIYYLLENLTKAYNHLLDNGKISRRTQWVELTQQLSYWFENLKLCVPIALNLREVIDRLLEESNQLYDQRLSHLEASELQGHILRVGRWFSSSQINHDL